MKQRQSRPFRVVVAFDFSDQSHLALRRALALAARYPLTLLHVVCALDKASWNDQFPSVGIDYKGADAIRAQMNAIANNLANELGPPSVKVYTHARLEPPETAVASVASDVAADLILVGTHSKSTLERWVLGSVSEHLVRHAPCSVMVVRDSDYDSERTRALLPEPPCAACVAVRRTTSGDQWFCDAHAEQSRPYESPLVAHYDTNMEQQRKDAWVLY